MAEKINLKEDRDFFTREFRNATGKGLITESTGRRLQSLLNDLFYTIDELPSASKLISEKDVNQIKIEIEKLEKLMAKILHKKGLLGW